MKVSSTVAVLAAVTTLALANADEYFTGDGTAYTLGDTSSGNCNMMSALSFATTDYAALNNDQWNGLQNCGRCAEVSCADSRCSDQTKSVVVQILDLLRGGVGSKQNLLPAYAYLPLRLSS